MAPGNGNWLVMEVMLMLIGDPILDSFPCIIVVLILNLFYIIRGKASTTLSSASLSGLAVHTVEFIEHIWVHISILIFVNTVFKMSKETKILSFVSDQLK